MTDDITIAGTKGGKPIYRLPPKDEPLTFMQKYLGETTFMAMSLTAVIKVGIMLGAGVGVPFLESIASWGGASASSGILSSGWNALIPLAGATVAGAFINKKQVEQRAAAGVEIKPPSRLNMGIAQGAMSGFIMGGGLLGLAVNGIAGLVGAGTILAAGPVLAIGVAGAAYGAWSKGNKHYEKASVDYDKIKFAYEVQEGIQSPAQARVKEAAKGIAEAVTIGAVGAGVDIPEVGGIAGAVAMDESQAAANESWHPANDRKDKPSFAEIEMKRREHKAVIDGAQEVAKSALGMG